MTMSDARYAIYYAPEPESDLAAFGRAWLGRDPETGARVAQPAVPGRPPGWMEAITAEPRRYGFHGTLKPPFRLAAGRGVRDLLAAAESLARGQPAIEIGRLALEVLGGFFALVPDGPVPALEAFAAACVRELDAFRAPPSPDELARRRRSGLSPRQDALLARWGYPYVMEEFRFHLTLTGRLDADDQAFLHPILEAATRDVRRRPVRMTGIAVFEQASSRAPFAVLTRFPLGGTRRA